MLDAFSLLVELGRVALVLPEVEEARTCLGPQPAADLVRHIGRSQRQRGEADRARLRRAIGWADRHLFHFVDGGNCYRRALLEMALDAGAARERLLLGFCTSAASSRQPGHAWLSGDRHTDRYDAVVAV